MIVETITSILGIVTGGNNANGQIDAQNRSTAAQVRIAEIGYDVTVEKTKAAAVSASGGIIQASTMSTAILITGSVIIMGFIAYNLTR